MKEWGFPLLLMSVIVVTFFVGLEVKADISGSFSFSATVQPVQTPASHEAEVFAIDLTTNLKLDVVLSGLTLSPDITLGNTGLEQVVLELAGTLGGLDLSSKSTFDTPTTPEGSPLGDIAFVKNAFVAKTDFLGFSLQNSLILADLDFPGNRTDPYNTGAFDNILDNQTPTFRVGDSITVQGTLEGGLRVRSITALCLSGSSPCESEILVFSSESLTVSNIELGGGQFDLSLTFKPDSPLQVKVGVAFSMAGLARLSASLETDDLLRLTLGGGSLRVSTDTTDFRFSFDETGEITTLNASFDFGLEPSSISARAKVTKGKGLTSFSVSLSRSLDRALRVRFSASFGEDKSQPGRVLFTTFVAALTATVEPFTLSVETRYASDGNFKAVFEGLVRF